MPISILNFKWAWQAQFLSYIPQILKKYVFFIDVQMILLPFFDIPNPKPVILEKPISSFNSRPQPGNFRQFLPCCGLDLKPKIGFSKITQKQQKISKNGINTICKPLQNTHFSKSRRL